MRTPEYEVVAEAGKAVEYGLFDVAEKIRAVIETGAWRRYVTPMNRVVEFPSFLAYVEGKRPDGLGTDGDTIRKVCRDDPGASDVVDKALKRPHGGDRRSVAARIKFDNVQLDSPTGNRSDAAIRRLRKDRPDLHGRVIAGELSPHAAAIEAGFRKRTITVPLDPVAAARTLRRHLTDAERSELCALLSIRSERTFR